MKQRVLVRLKKDFQVGSEDWNDVLFTGQRIRLMKVPQSGIEKETRKKISTVPLQSILGTAAFWDR